jgi:zinc protease
MTFGNKRSSKTRSYWVLIIGLVVILPLAALFYFGKLNFFNKSSAVSSMVEFQIPKISEQPKDTLVASKVIPIHSWNTSNGVKVLFVPTETLPIVDIDVSIDAGSSRDGSQYGIASFVSEMLNQGTKTMPSADEIAIGFEKVGAMYNVSVDRDKTEIGLRSLNIKRNQELDKLITLFADVIANPSFNDKNLDVVREQTLVKIKYNDQLPKNVAFKEFFKLLYNDHPYAHNIYGETNTVQELTKEALQQFHKQYYVAENAVISIVGGIHRDKAKALAEIIALKLPKGTKAESIPAVQPLTQKVVKKIDFPVNQSQILVGRLGLDVTDPEKYALTIGNYILGGGNFSSRLFKNIRVANGLAYSVYTSLDPMQQPGPFFATLETKVANTKNALKLLQDDCQDFITTGPTESEVEKAKKYLIGSIPMAFDSNSNILSAVAALGFYNLPLDYYDNYAANIEKVTLEDVKGAVAKRLNLDNAVQVVLSAK